MPKKIDVVVLEEHFITRKGIINLLAENPRIKVVGEGSTGEELAQLVNAHTPDLLITELQMPSRKTKPRVLFAPVPGLRAVKKEHPQLDILVISQEQDFFTIHALAEIGVNGYMLKTDNFAANLSQAVEMIHMGLMYFSPAVMGALRGREIHNRWLGLTNQQLTVLRAVIISPGATRAALAESLHISPSTLQKHITAIFQALDVPNMEAAIIKALRLQIVNPELIFSL